MNNETIAKKEEFLKNIDTNGLTSDERLIIASKGFDTAFDCGVKEVAGEYAPDAPEGSIVKVRTFVHPDYSTMDKKELKAQEAELNKAYKVASEANNINDMLEVLVRLEALAEAQN